MSPTENADSIAKDYLIVYPEVIYPREKVVVEFVLNNMGLSFTELDNSTPEARDYAAKKLSDSINKIADVKPGPQPENTKKIRAKKYEQFKSSNQIDGSKTAEYYGAIKAQMLGARIIEIYTDNPNLAEDDYKQVHLKIKKTMFAATNLNAADYDGIRKLAAGENDPDIEPIIISEI